jgi:hypothetical protein
MRYWELILSAGATLAALLLARANANIPVVVAPQDGAAKPSAKAEAPSKPLRVLLMAGGPTREYQFLRSLLVRQVDAKQAELSIYLQGGARGERMQDVTPDRLLKQFPTYRHSEDDPKAPYLNLARYHLIIAIDPDWAQLDARQAGLLKDWVEKRGGGLIVVGGPVNTLQLVRKDAGQSLKPILALYPVVLDDSRLAAAQLRPSDKPGRLNFPGAKEDIAFLKLDAAGKEPLAGWEAFFTNDAKPEKGQRGEVVRGFYTYYPVKEVKPGATVIATFSDPRARLADGRAQPYLVSMPQGKGRVVYLGSGEAWRLRAYHEDFFDRFWLGLAHFAQSAR